MIVSFPMSEKQEPEHPFEYSGYAAKLMKVTVVTAVTAVTALLGRFPTRGPFLRFVSETQRYQVACASLRADDGCVRRT
jgi:hypothetical protein